MSTPKGTASAQRQEGQSMCVAEEFLLQVADAGGGVVVLSVLQVGESRIYHVFVLF